MKYTQQQVDAGLDYIMGVHGWVKLTYGEEVADNWLKAENLDTKYFIEYNADYERFFQKLMNLSKKQKEAVEEVMLHRVYKRIACAQIDERLEKKLEQLETY